MRSGGRQSSEHPAIKAPVTIPRSPAFSLRTTNWCCGKSEAGDKARAYLHTRSIAFGIWAGRLAR